MRIIVKWKDEIRIYNGDNDFESICKFVNQQFCSNQCSKGAVSQQTQKQEINFSYTDEQGDKIMILHQYDFENFLVMVSHKAYVKLQAYKDNSQSMNPDHSQDQQNNGQKQEQIEVQTIQAETIIENPRDDSQLLNIREETQRLETQEIYTKSKQIDNYSQAQNEQVQLPTLKEQKISSQKKQQTKKNVKTKKDSVSNTNKQIKTAKYDMKMINLNKITSLIERNIQQLVNEKIKHLIPCIKRQILISGKQQAYVQKVKTKLVHIGYSCIGCSIQPIIGVRYECPQCKIFNICQVCQAEIQHDHSLLKHKSVVNKQNEKLQKTQKNQHKKQILDLSSKIINQLVKQAQTGKQVTQGPKLKGAKKKQEIKTERQKKIQLKKICEIQKQQKKNAQKLQRQELAKKKLETQKKLKIDRRCIRFGKMFQKPKKIFEQFIQKTLDMQLNKAVQLYSQQNNIDLKQKAVLKQDKMVNKIGDYFNKDAQQYRKFVIKYPSVPFSDLLKLMKEEGVQDYTEPKYKQKRAKLMRDQSVKIQTPLVQFEKQQQSSEWIDFPPNQDYKNCQEKGKVLLKMKQIFGEADSKQYFTFIGKNFQLGEQKIIEAWKQTHNLKPIV